VVFCLAAFAAVLPGCSTAPASSPTPTPAITATPTPTPTPQNQQPVEIVSISGPLAPINPGGPIVEITLKNISAQPVVALSARLDLGTPRSFVFNFAVAPAGPLLPAQTISAKLTLIGGGFSSGVTYPLAINGSLRNGDNFSYTRQVLITPPASNSPEISLAPIHEVKVSIMKSNPVQIGVHIQGGLRDGCTTFNAIETTRAGFAVNIKVTTQHPVDVACPALYGYFEKDLNLGSDFTAGSTYTLNVNDYTTTFIYP
jgi:hypothetical protein